MRRVNISKSGNVESFERFPGSEVVVRGVAYVRSNTAARLADSDHKLIREWSHSCPYVKSGGVLQTVVVRWRSKRSNLAQETYYHKGQCLAIAKAREKAAQPHPDWPTAAEAMEEFACSRRTIENYRLNGIPLLSGIKLKCRDGIRRLVGPRGSNLYHRVVLVYRPTLIDLQRKLADVPPNDVQPIREAASSLRVSQSTLRKAVKDGRLLGRRLPIRHSSPRRVLHVPISEPLALGDGRLKRVGSRRWTDTDGTVWAMVPEGAKATSLPTGTIYGWCVGKPCRPLDSGELFRTTKRDGTRYVDLRQLERIALRCASGEIPAGVRGSEHDQALEEQPAESNPACDPRTSASPNSYPDEDNYDRDKWLYEQRAAGRTLTSMKHELSMRIEFNQLESDNGIRKAIRQYCRHTGQLYPTGSGGRPRSSSS